MTDISKDAQRFVAAFNVAISELEKETKEAEESSKKGELEIETVRSSITKTKIDVENRKQIRGEIESEQKVVDNLVRDHKTMEQKYNEIFAKETAKVDEIKRKHSRLVNEKTRDGFETFTKLQDILNKRLEDAMSRSKVVQNARDLQGTKELEETVAALKQEVREETKKFDELTTTSVNSAFTTTAEERAAAASYVKNATNALQKKYISTRLELYNLKHKHSK